jgi:hypothetical protein
MMTTARLAFRRVVGLVVGFAGRRLVGSMGAVRVLGGRTVFADNRVVRVLLGLVAAARGSGTNLGDAVARNDSVHVVFGQLLNV